MKIKDSWLIIVTLLLILGVILYYERRPVIAEPPPDYVWAKMDPNSSRTYTTILMPTLNKTYGRIEELKAQNEWLRRSLDKCLRKLEAERGLEPILPKYHLPLRGDPNLAGNYHEESERWFALYEEPNVPSLLEEPDVSVKFLVCLMGIRGASDSVYIDSLASWIENFEKRLERLETHLEK